VLDWKLRKDPRVVVMERTNAMHVELPVAMELITIDVAWTKQRFIMPSAKRLLSPGGVIVSLVKPHYEAPPAKLRGGVLPEEFLHEVLSSVKTDVESAGMQWVAMTNSPIRGTGGNSEVLVMLRK
jgi:23S rRNA (cytidine1920-2'-O)/16S rRNA (cytidine1409-2'-O)-methyltransferase